MAFPAALARTVAFGPLIGLVATAISAASPAPALQADPTPTSTESRVLAGDAARSASARTTPRWSGAIDTSSRSAVEGAYRSRFAPALDVASGWTGDTRNCEAGTISDEARRATLDAINVARSLAGLAPVGLDPTLDARSQQTALMMSANGRLSHRPDSSWRCWTRVGADNAARSNLALAYPSITPGTAIDLYLEDDGAHNRAVGHRRWLLNPFTTHVGVGVTDDAQSLTILGPTSASRPNPAWVAWPTAGWFPDRLEPSGRWSFSAGNRALGFAKATVAVYRNGSRVNVTKHPAVKGYAQPTLVWEMPDSVARSGTFKVVVKGITRPRTKRRLSHTYVVRMFTPAD